LPGLKAFLVRRFLTFIPTLIGVTFLVFIIANIIPANPARSWAGGTKAKPEVVERIKKEYHLNDPWYIQYLFFIKKIFTNDIVSPRTHNKIWDDLLFGVGESRYGRFFITLQLALIALLYIIFIAIPLGILSALKKNTLLDSAVRTLALIGVSSPSFWLGYLLIYLFFIKVRLISIAGIPQPTSMITGVMVLDALIQGEYNTALEIIYRLSLPAFVLGFIEIGIVARMTRNSFLDAWSSSYIDFAEARGFRKIRIIRHALKNALVPIITIVGIEFGFLLGGAPIIEAVFGIPGLGMYMVQAIYYFDYPALIGSVFLFALTFMSVNLIADILYAFVDPRIRY